MSEHTVRKYQELDQLPIQLPKKPRGYRTRTDPLASYWPLVETQLKADPHLKPYALLEWLRQRAQDPAHGLPPLSSNIRRTLERRVRSWKVDQRVVREVPFPRIHHPGDVLAFDFVHLNELGVTIAGQPSDHLLFDAVLTYPNWE
jgi:hypothetical protein